jgi:hypothetical protein
MDDFCAATATDARAVGHRRLAVRAQQHVHVRSIVASLCRTNQFSLCRIQFANANVRYHTVLARFQGVITLRHRTNPFHAEILEREQQRSKVPAVAVFPYFSAILLWIEAPIYGDCGESKAGPSTEK